ncbi:Tom22 protein [Martiniozyma asiatica (nom. inval.)]|nr:Tom22 protein [Martiniozyma asiatica]
MVELTQVPEEYNPAEVDAVLSETIAATEALADAVEAEAEAEAEDVQEAVEKLEQELAESESDEESDDEDDFDPNETIVERIQALKQILTPKQRESIISGASTAKSLFKSGTLKFGSTLWYLATGGMLLGVPLAIAIFGETQLMELEKELGGMGAPAAAPAPAPAEAK